MAQIIIGDLVPPTERGRRLGMIGTIYATIYPNAGSARLNNSNSRAPTNKASRSVGPDPTLSIG